MYALACIKKHMHPFMYAHIDVWMHWYIHVQFNARCVCKGMNTLDMLTCRDVSMYACMNEQMYTCAHIHIKASNIACLHLWNYGVYSHRCTQAHNNIMCTCLHLSNYECVCVDACIRIYTYANIYIFHMFIHACVLVHMYAWKHVEVMKIWWKCKHS